MISAESRKLIVTSLFIVICTIHTKYLYSVLAVFDYIWNITTHSICINVFIFRHVGNNNNYWILWWFFLRIWWLYIVINTLAVNIDHNHAHHSHNGLTKKYIFSLLFRSFPPFFLSLILCITAYAFKMEILLLGTDLRVFIFV